MTKPLSGPKIAQLVKIMDYEFSEQHLEREGLHCTKLERSQQRAECSLIVVSLLLVTALQATGTGGGDFVTETPEQSSGSGFDMCPRESVDI